MFFYAFLCFSALHASADVNKPKVLLSLGNGRLERQQPTAAPVLHQRPFKYDYRVHGEDWVIGTCGSRERQSPVDLPKLPKVSAAGQSTTTLYYSYEPVTMPFTVMSSGKTIAADFAKSGWGGVTYDNAYYNLISVTFHAHSEHTVEGKSYPLEVHIVHEREGGTELLMVAIFIDGHDARCPEMGCHLNPETADSPPDVAFDFFAKNVPTLMNITSVKATEVKPFELNSWMGGNYYFYEGSLTAPPCTENVMWFVRQEPVKASNDQVRALVNALYSMTYDMGNYRAVLPLMRRSVHVVPSAVGDPVAEAPPALRSKAVEREYKAVTDAREAMQLANMNAQKVRDLDDKLRAASVAHANAMGGYPKLFPSFAPISP